jgi:hypothetical protein
MVVDVQREHNPMRISRFRSAVLPVALVAGLLATVPAAGSDATGDHRYVSDTFNVSLGTFAVAFDTNAQAGSNVIGGLIQFEDDLAIESRSTSGRLDGLYRFGPRHAIDFGYFSLNRNGTRVLDRQIVYNDVQYDVGVSVETDFDVDLFRVTYRYSFVNDGKTEAGFTAGLSTYGFLAAVQGQATVDDGGGGTTQQFVRAEEEVLAPIPVGGLFVAHAFTRKLVLRLGAEVFDLDRDDYSVRVVDTRILFDWYFSRHVGVGVGKSNTTIDFTDESSDGFAVEYEQDGLLAYVTLVF